MKIAQIYEILNTITSEQLGTETVVSEDLSNIVDIGREFENTVGLDNYVRALSDHVGRMVFVNRVYRGAVPSVLMDGWEYGSILEKITAKLPQAYPNESWELVDGTSYDPNIFYKPQVTVKCFNDRVTFEIPVSITEKQVKSAFTTPTQMNAFISMLYTAIENAMTLKIDSLIMRCINNMTAETVYSEYADAKLDTKTGVRAVNLLKMYNDIAETALTAANALQSTEFLKFAAKTMSQYMDRMATMSTLFNVGATEKFTPKSENHVVMLSDFKQAADFYLQSSTFNDQYTRLPNAEIVPYWQGSGETYAFADVSKIDVKTATNNSVTVTGLLAVMFDRNALGVANLDRRVTTQYNAKGEFWNEWHKFDAGYFNDLNENFVAFFIA